MQQTRRDNGPMTKGDFVLAEFRVRACFRENEASYALILGGACLVRIPEPEVVGFAKIMMNRRHIPRAGHAADGDPWESGVAAA